MSHFEKLKENPQGHHIFHALRIIEAEHSDKPRLGRSKRPKEDGIRLGQEAELAFPPSTVRSYEAQTATKPATLINRFFGFFGPHGPLPIHLTEYARERHVNAGDTTLTSFANMLTHRFMSLMYRAWVTGQPAVDFDRGEGSQFDSHIAALAGHHGKALRNRDAMPDLAKRHLAGHLALGPKNGEGLIAMLSAFFDAPFRLQEFVGCWLDLEPDDQWQLGADGGLGQTTSVGSRVWSRSAKFRILVGPLPIKEYERLLPGSPSMDRLAAIVRNYCGDALDFDLNVILKGDEVPKAILGQQTRLGQTSWVGERLVREDAADLFLEPLNYRKKVA
ncbi:MAG: type VI secretion system baseplate subunit TssG [Amylibacter sp.]|jgi:type VI secretion system protein ImpH